MRGTQEFATRIVVVIYPNATNCCWLVADFGRSIAPWNLVMTMGNVIASGEAVDSFPVGGAV